MFVFYWYKHCLNIQSCSLYELDALPLGHCACSAAFTHHLLNVSITHTRVHMHMDTHMHTCTHALFCTRTAQVSIRHSMGSGPGMNSNNVHVGFSVRPLPPPPKGPAFISSPDFLPWLPLSQNSHCRSDTLKSVT